jgi:hypothetical protein
MDELAIYTPTTDKQSFSPTGIFSKKTLDVLNSVVVNYNSGDQHRVYESQWIRTQYVSQ